MVTNSPKGTFTLTVTTAFPYRLGPISNISPFSYRDGATYLEILYALRDYINVTLRPEFDTEIQAVLDQFQAGVSNAEATVTAQAGDWTTKFNAYMADVTASLQALNDHAMATLVDAPTSETAVALSTLYGTKAWQDTTAALLANGGRLSQTSLDAAYASAAALATTQAALTTETTARTSTDTNLTALTASTNTALANLSDPATITGAAVALNGRTQRQKQPVILLAQDLGADPTGAWWHGERGRWTGCPLSRVRPRRAPVPGPLGSTSHRLRAVLSRRSGGS